MELMRTELLLAGQPIEVSTRQVDEQRCFRYWTVVQVSVTAPSLRRLRRDWRDHEEAEYEHEEIVAAFERFGAERV